MQSIKQNLLSPAEKHKSWIVIITILKNGIVGSNLAYMILYLITFASKNQAHLHSALIKPNRRQG